MAIATSQIMSFLEQRESFAVHRYEIASAEFGLLRRSLRQIVIKLKESDDNEALAISDGLRVLLSEWLTTPLPFDQSLAEGIRDSFGDANTIRLRWGADIRSLFDIALKTATRLPTIENPMRRKLKEILEELRLQGLSYRIYCHRRARPHFESLLESVQVVLSEDLFLHSVRDYREAETFDVLIKVGPLRSRGWGSAPDALLTAPRFRTLDLVVWSGSGDEPGFGYDPSKPINDAAKEGEFAARRTAQGLPEWTVSVTRTGEDPHNIPGNGDEWDELQVFSENRQLGEKRPAKLVQVDEAQGILFPPYSQVLSFNPTRVAPEPIDWRIPGETLLEGMYLIIDLLDEIDLGNLQARHGYYSQIWKAKLVEARITDEEGLMERLRASGLNLRHLKSAINHWCSPPGTVIHAPQKVTHFEILLRVLGVAEDAVAGETEPAFPWWKRAWTEIRRSRGEAIQAGVLEQELVDEQLLLVLKNLLPMIREKATCTSAFDLAVPETSGMRGFLRFFPVRGIEDGFYVPDAQLRVVIKLNEIDQWRD